MKSVLYGYLVIVAVLLGGPVLMACEDNITEVVIETDTMFVTDSFRDTITVTDTIPPDTIFCYRKPPWWKDRWHCR